MSKIMADSIKEGDRYVDELGQPIWTATSDAVRAIEGREVHIPIQYDLDGGRSVRIGGRDWAFDGDRIQRVDEISDLDPAA